MNDLFLFIKNILKLSRFRLSAAIAFSALAGFLICAHSFDLRALFAFTGVFLLSSCASALNQLQQRKTDALMDRTKNRPLPAGKVRPRQAVITAGVSGIAGLLILLAGTNAAAALLGIINLILNNCIYTPLKRRTFLVIFPGALVGAVPPVMGWAAAGGNVLSPVIIFVAFFMFMWQIPHFLLLIMKYGEEYSKAGLPCITARVDNGKAGFITFAWIIATSLSALFFPMFHVISTGWLSVLLVITNVCFIIIFYRLLFPRGKIFNFNFAFYSIYAYQAAIFIILIAGGVFLK